MGICRNIKAVGLIMITMNRVIRILLIAVSFVLIVYVSSWLSIQTRHGAVSNEENFIIMLVIGLGWLAAFHFLAFSTSHGVLKHCLMYAYHQQSKIIVS